MYLVDISKNLKKYVKRKDYKGGHYKIKLTLFNYDTQGSHIPRISPGTDRKIQTKPGLAHCCSSFTNWTAGLYVRELVRQEKGCLVNSAYV